MIPRNAQILGFGPMLPLVAAGISTRVLPGTWPILAVQLAMMLGALILAFVAGVRTRVRLRAAGGVDRPGDCGGARLFHHRRSRAGGASAARALALLAAGYAGVALLDRRAALIGSAPAFFAKLRPPQFLLGAAGLAACWAWLP
ncbi:DUF3429 domain-containing protein [Sphingomonas sp. MMS24-JH45]